MNLAFSFGIFVLIGLLSIQSLAECEVEISESGGSYDIVFNDFSVYPSGVDACLIEIPVAVTAGYKAQLGVIAIGGSTAVYSGLSYASIEAGASASGNDFSYEQAFVIVNHESGLETECGAVDTVLSATIEIGVADGFIGVSSGSANISIVEC